MKKALAFTLAAMLTLSCTVPALAAGVDTPSGISYNDIGTEIDAYVERY